MSTNIIKQLEFIKKVPQYEQRSPEWFEQRRDRLTSSDVATALGMNPYKKPIELLIDKCLPKRPYMSNESTRHGQKYENYAIDRYSDLMGKENHEFGMISFADLDPIRTNQKYNNEKYHFLGGSPDGIAIDRVLTEDSVLTQLEVKCPFRRKIKHGQIPEYYFPQVQLNMFILDLEVTDFIEYIPPNMQGKSEELNIVRVFRDEEWFDKIFLVLEKFWQDILYWRKLGIENHPEFQKNNPNKPVIPKVVNVPKYLFIETDEEKPFQEMNKSRITTIDTEECMFD